MLPVFTCLATFRTTKAPIATCPGDLSHPVKKKKSLGKKESRKKTKPLYWSSSKEIPPLSFQNITSGMRTLHSSNLKLPGKPKLGKL
jgi:hypothetical protein